MSGETTGGAAAETAAAATRRCAGPCERELPLAMFQQRRANCLDCARGATRAAKRVRFAALSREYAALAARQDDPVLRRRCLRAARDYATLSRRCEDG